MLLGIGGTTEGMVTAVALKCMEGDFQGRLWARDAELVSYTAEHGLSLTDIVTIDDLIRSEDVFFAASGVTAGDLL